MISWVMDSVISAVPWYVWTIMAGVALAATFQFWGPIWLAMPGWMKKAILAVGAILTFGYMARRSGINAERERRDAANARANAERNRIDEDLRNASDDDLARRHDRWMRKDP